LSEALEAGPQTAWLYDLPAELGAEVTVVNPNKVRLIAEGRRKTDKIGVETMRRVRMGRHPPSVRQKAGRSTGKSLLRRG